MGSSKQSVARCLASAISENMTVVVPEVEFHPIFQKTSDEQGAKLVRVGKDLAPETLPNQLAENVHLALAVTGFLGIDKEAALRGMKKARPDLGATRIWTADVGSPPSCWHLVSLFAANDPESTRIALSRVQETKHWASKEMTGLLNLRRDRGDRTLQWLEALRKDAFPEIHRLFLVGGHSMLFESKLPKSIALKETNPEQIMDAVSETNGGETILIGMGNMGGIGREMVRHWQDIGMAHDV
jgi:poly-gamma-glutamate synthase PgsB/CapB